MAAQRRAIEDFAQSRQMTIADSEWYQDVQSGKGSDALALRPGLRSALQAAKRVKGPLIVAHLSRLARNSHFIGGLLEQEVRFIVTPLPDADKFTLQIHAAVDEKEGAQISERTRAALARSSKKLGMRGKSKTEQRRIRALAMRAKATAANVRAEALRPQIEFVLKDGASLRDAADALNNRGIPSPFGARWHAPSLLKAARRLGLREAKAA
jgi:DNA invertase Pin-like site-specific DNA recombinase